jgi:hypothetical protein
MQKKIELLQRIHTLVLSSVRIKLMIVWNNNSSTSLEKMSFTVMLIDSLFQKFEK